MKKILLLTVLLVAAASAAITFPNGIPSKVGVAVQAAIPGSGTALLFINDGQNRTWVLPQSTPMGDTNWITPTHPGTGLKLVAQGSTTEESASFDVVIGDAKRWQVIAPGEIAVPGDATNLKGKSGSSFVDAGESEEYNINECDTFFNSIEDSPTGFAITSNCPYYRVSGTNVELRTVGTWTVTVSGSPYLNDESTVKVYPKDATQLLIKCSGETLVPGDTLDVQHKGGKDGTPAAAVVGSPYAVTIYAVDDAWNVDTSFSGTAYVNGGTSGGVTSDTVTLTHGVGYDTITFALPDPSGKNIYANTVSGGSLKTEYPTQVVVNEGVLFIDPELNPAIVPIGVRSTLTVTVYSDSATTIPSFPVEVKMVVDSLKNFFHILDDTENDDIVTIYTDQNGVATTEVWGDSERTYPITVTGGDKTKTTNLTVKEVTGLTIAPNPWKYGAQGHDKINFTYKVDQAGAAEVMLLITDIYGNIVYKNTYTSGMALEPGQQTITWNCMNSKGNRVASGMYQAVLKITLTNLSSQVLKKNLMVIW